MSRWRPRALAAALGAVVLCTACGQKGPLVLPRSGAAAASAPAAPASAPVR